MARKAGPATLMISNKPKVSVLMSVFNGDRYLQQAIDSIINQSYTHFEFVIVDDGSSQETKKILAAQKDRRIVLITNSSNIGLTKSLNLGLSKCRGKYIARMDSDDISHPERLARQVEFLDHNPSVAVIGTQVRVIDHTGKARKYTKINRGTSTLSCKWQHLFDSPIAHPTAMFRQDIIMDEQGGYNEKYATSQDFELWSRVIKSHEITNLNQILLDFRTHNDSVSRRYNKAALAEVANVYQSNVTATIGIHSELSSFGLNWVTVTNPHAMNGLDDYDKVLKQLLFIHKIFLHRYQSDLNAAIIDEIRSHMVDKLYVIGLAASDTDRLTTIKSFFLSFRFSKFSTVIIQIKLLTLAVIKYSRIKRLRTILGF